FDFESGKQSPQCGPEFAAILSGTASRHSNWSLSFMVTIHKDKEATQWVASFLIASCCRMLFGSVRE
ncbi:MAG: hypothetical protein ACRDC4_02045, partial [Plesiomonas sp.]